MKTIWITGGEHGIGSATADLLAAEGWRVHATAHDEVDVTDWEQVQNFAASLRTIGPIHAVFANAGFAVENSFHVGGSPKKWREMILTNILGVAYTVRATIPYLLQTKGHVLITGSAMGRRYVPGSLYCASKHAVHAIAENLRLELDGTGVRVTNVAPGVVDTKFWDHGMIKPALEHPLQPQDVARAVKWALEQPTHMDVNEVLVRPVEQQQ